MRRPSRRLASSAPPPLRGRVSFALVCSLVIALTMAALLALNIAAARASYAQQDLASRLAVLTEEQQALAEQLEARQAPSALEEAAADLGMVPANRAFVSMRDGELLGDASPARRPPTEQDAEPEQVPGEVPEQTTDPDETSDAATGTDPEDRSDAVPEGDAGAPTTPGDAP